MTKKHFIVPILILVLVFTTCACGKTPIADSNGKMLKYKIDEIENEGFYVHNKEDDTFSPVNNGASGYQGQATQLDTSRFIWLGNNELDLVNLIPKVDGVNTELVAIFNSENNMPSFVSLEQYKNLGYTLGVQFTVSEDSKTLYIDSNNICKSSAMVKTLSSVSEALLPVHSINENTDLPIANVDREINILVGLEKDKPYEISFYDGTKFHSKIVEADTIALKSKQLININKPFKKTKKGYFVVNLPENIKNGYYYVNDAGLFAYKSASK